MVKSIPLELLECAPTAGSSPLAREHAESTAATLKAIADPTRLQIVAMIARGDQQEDCVCNLTGPLGLTQPTVSHHLKVLVEAEILNRERRGTWVWYSLNKERWNRIAELFSA
ncbi:MAG: hypothetical protein RLZ96_442 [Actinomycetota bacterium]|jgi:ArsR family transcriptional regulator